MEQKFVSFEDAVEKLGISPERLQALREDGQLRAYRDGKSWKFRGDEIAKMVEAGVPDAPPPSDIGLVSPDELVEAAPIDSGSDDDLGLAMLEEDTPGADDKSDLDLSLDLDDTDAVPGGSKLDLAGLDDTVTATGSDIALDLELPEPGPGDSILLSEEALGESVTGSPSTIIGRGKSDSSEDDLELALDEGSDVKLAPSAGASDVLSAGVAGSGILDDLDTSSGGTSAFKDLEELEIDLSAESSRVLTPEEVAQAKSASKKDDDDLPLSELELDDSDSSADIELAGDDDLILDGSGSDLTLDSGDSGINLISPGDSGLALDDIPLEMGGSAILSSLSLEGSDPEISLIGEDANSGEGSMAELQTDDDFQLTPLSEGAEAEGDSSSQVIALDGDIEDFSADVETLEEVDFGETEGDVVLSDDFADASAGGGLEAGYAPIAVAAGPETSYTTLNIVLLGCSTMFLMLGGVMMFDMMRYIWSWDQEFSLNSSLIEAILGLF